MNYKAFYRTYRPTKFEDVVGQDHIVKTLVNLINMKKISHGYLFSGPRGTGKTSIAKIFANAINCIHSEKPEDICAKCLANSNSTLDIIEMDAASNNSVNDIRTIREQVKFAPTNSPYKIYIIDEVHMLSNGAFNALLMTLEEPPAHAIFILATTDPDKIPDTILSRVQRYNFKRINKNALESQLKFVFRNENVNYDEESVKMIASLANGSLRDALSIADQINAFSNSNISVDKLIEIFGLSTLESQVHLINLLANKLVSESLEFFDNLVNNGIDISKLITSLIELLKNYLIYSKTKNLSLVDNVNVEVLESIVLKTDAVYKILDILTPLLSELKYTDIPQQLMQLAIIKICSFDESMVDIEKKDITIMNLKPSKNHDKEMGDSQIINIEKTNENIFNTSTNLTTSKNDEDVMEIIEEDRDITDEYFGIENNDSSVNTSNIDSTITMSQSVDLFKETNNYMSEKNLIDTNDSTLYNSQQKTNTRTILADFSNEKIEKNFENLMGDFSLNDELNKMKNNQIPLESNISNTNPISTKDFNTQTQHYQNKNNSASKIIDDTTELLNISHEIDGNENDVNEALLNHYDTSKQVFDTNEIDLVNESETKSILDKNINDETQSSTKEFAFGSKTKETAMQTAPINLETKLTQPAIVNLFLLSKRDTFPIFKQKLENSSCTTKEEYDSFAVLIKEVRFICSSNDFILVSSEEDWVINDINEKSNDKRFKQFVADYFGNNIHFYAITKKEYIVSKELYEELRKSGKMPQPKPLNHISNTMEYDYAKSQNEINDLESKSKSLFGNLFSRKKE